jgi:hypothetical protein
MVLLVDVLVKKWCVEETVAPILDKIFEKLI